MATKGPSSNETWLSVPPEAPITQVSFAWLMRSCQRGLVAENLFTALYASMVACMPRRILCCLQLSLAPFGSYRAAWHEIEHSC